MLAQCCSWQPDVGPTFFWQKECYLSLLYWIKHLSMLSRLPLSMLVLSVRKTECHFSDDTWIIRQIRCKFDLALIQIVKNWLLQNFAHATTAMLSWHVQNFLSNLMIYQAHSIATEWSFQTASENCFGKNSQFFNYVDRIFGVLLSGILASWKSISVQISPSHQEFFNCMEIPISRIIVSSQQYQSSIDI